MRKKMFLEILVVVMLAAPVGLCATETETAAVVTAWNEDASSPWLTADYLAKSLPAWQVKQMAWPDAEEVEAASVDVKEHLKTWCVRWLKKHIKPEYLPAEIESKLVAMNNWEGLADPKSPKLPRDVFLVRYTTGGIVVHIQEDPRDITVAVAPVAAEAKARTDHKEFFVEIGGLILIEDALEDAMEDGTEVKDLWLKTTTTASGSTVSTTKSWTLDGGTDGRFVWFRIHKYTGGPHESSPSEQRF